MNKREISIQIIEVIAIVLIVIGNLFNCSDNRLISCLGSIASIGVLMFLLVAGYLYKQKSEGVTFNTCLRKVTTLLLPTCIFIIFVLCINIKIIGEEWHKNISTILHFTEKICDTECLWIILLIVISYLITPILHKLKSVLNGNRAYILLSLVIILFWSLFLSRKISLFICYVFAFYIGYLIREHITKFKSIPQFVLLLMTVGAIIFRIIGKLLVSDLIFYETIIVTLTNLMWAVVIFNILYELISDISIRSNLILKLINFLDDISHFVFIVHYIYIVVPIDILNITKYFGVNVLIYSVLTMLSAYALKVFVEAIMNINVKEWKLISVLQFLEILLIVIYKYLLAYNYRNNMILLPIAFVTGILTLIIMWIKRRQYKKRDLVVFGILTSLSAVTMWAATSVNFVFPILIAMSFYNNDSKKIAKYFFIALLIGFIITLVLNCIGILPDKNLSRTINGVEYIRYSLGFSNVNFVMLYYTFIILAAYYAYGLTAKFMFLSNFGAVILYSLCLTRTAFMCIIAFNVVIIFSKCFKKFDKILKYTVPYAFLLLTILAITFTVVSKYCDMPIINKFLNGRVKFNLEALERGYFTTAFGIREKLDIPLDMYYLYPLVKFGIVGCIIYSLLTCLSLYRLRNDKALMITQIIVLLYGLGDTNVIVSSINFVISVQVLALINDKNARIKGDLIYEKRKN